MLLKKTYYLQKSVGDKAKEGFAKFNGTEYVVGSTSTVLCKTFSFLYNEQCICILVSTVIYKLILIDYASGTTADWAYGTQNISLGYTLEFRDSGNYDFKLQSYVISNILIFTLCALFTGSYGFILPADQIIPNSIEALDALIAMVADARRHNVL